MTVAVAVSSHPVTAEAVGEVLGEVIEAGGVEPDLALLFATPDHQPMLVDAARAVRSLLRPAHLLGAASSAVVGRASEIEDATGLVLWAAWGLPADTRRLRVERRSEGVVVGGLELSTIPEGAVLLALVDPYSLPCEPFLGHLADQRPDLTLIGGLAGAGRAPGGNLLLVDGDAATDGAVLAVLDPANVPLAAVSQGCRPIGEPMVVTRARGNLIEELAGRPALAQLLALADEADPDDAARLAAGVHVGIVIDERRPTFGRGDYLVRNVLGTDADQQIVAVGAAVEVGTTVCFQVRDATTAREDLDAALSDASGDGALLFTCNGRGRRFFDEPDHDARTVVDRLDSQGVAGMFCAGEIGPVGGRSFLHGFTASIAVVETGEGMAGRR